MGNSKKQYLEINSKRSHLPSDEIYILSNTPIYRVGNALPYLYWLRLMEKAKTYECIGHLYPSYAIKRKCAVLRLTDYDDWHGEKVYEPKVVGYVKLKYGVILRLSKKGFVLRKPFFYRGRYDKI